MPRGFLKLPTSIDIKNIWRPRVPNPTGYPFDFDASLHFARPKTGIDYFPSPSRIGALRDMVPMQDAFVLSLMVAPSQWGPFSTTQPTNIGYQEVFPSLQKTVG